MNCSEGPNDPYTIESPDGYVMVRCNSLEGAFIALENMPNIRWDALEMTPDRQLLKARIEAYVPRHYDDLRWHIKGSYHNTRYFPL